MARAGALMRSGLQLRGFGPAQRAGDRAWCFRFARSFRRLPKHTPRDLSAPVRLKPIDSRLDLLDQFLLSE
jgi:hypothetical protein